jgi:phage shock protein PspC (stress-responsive transcriptional regulator)
VLFLAFGSGLVLYILAWIFAPIETTTPLLRNNV